MKYSAWIAGVFLVLVAALLVWSLSSRSPDAPSPPAAITDSEALPGELGWERALSASGDSSAADPGGRALAEARDGPAGSASPSPSRLARLIELLRAKSPRSGFHTLAWPLVGEIGACLDAGRPEDSALLLQVVANDRESELVRGALLVAMARSPMQDRVTAFAREWIASGSPELERAAWVARSLAEGVSAGQEVPLAGFVDSSELVTFPARLSSFAPTVAEDARLRVGEALPQEYWDDFGPADPQVQDEVFARRIALLAGLGPAVSELPWVSDFLLEVVTSRSDESRVIEKAATYVLALAVRDDEALAERLLAAAREVGRPSTEILILTRVALDGGRVDLSVGPLLDLLRSVEDNAMGSMSVAFGVDLLTHMMRAESNEVRTKALDFAVDRFLDPSVPAVHRGLYLNRIAAVDSELLIDAAEALLATEDNWQVLEDTIPYLSDVEGIHHARCRDLLANSYASVGASTQRAILTTVAQLRGQGSIDFLRWVASSDEDEGRRAMAQELLEARVR